MPAHGGEARVWAWLFLGAAAAAFLLYVLGLYLLARLQRAPLVLALTLAGAIQLAPLAGPVLVSTDVYTYWDYGRLAAVHDANPYEERPSAFPDDPAYPRMGARWRETTSVYGPGFTLASEAHAISVGESATAAAWLYKGLAAGAMLALAALAAALAERRAYAAAFVGWNPLLALHFAGGGHNDAWMMALVLAALALGAVGRKHLAGAAWALAVAVKWVPLVFLPLRALEARRQGRSVGHLGFAAAAVLVAAVATFRYGTAWLDAAGPIADNLRDTARWSIPRRVAGLGLPAEAATAVFAALFGIAYAWLLWQAWRGRARLALAAGILLVTTPWLVPWYAVWAVPLAAVEDDVWARRLALAASAYLIPAYIPV